MYTDEEIEIIPQQNGINELPDGKQFGRAR